MTNLLSNHSVTQYGPVLVKSNSLNAVNNKQQSNGSIKNVSYASIPDSAMVEDEKNGKAVPVGPDVTDEDTDEEDTTDSESKDNSDDEDLHTVFPDDFLEKIQVYI